MPFYLFYYYFFPSNIYWIENWLCMVYEVSFAGDFFLRHTFILFNMLMFTDILSMKNKETKMMSSG